MHPSKTQPAQGACTFVQYKSAKIRTVETGKISSEDNITGDYLNKRRSIAAPKRSGVHRRALPKHSRWTDVGNVTTHKGDGREKNASAAPNAHY